MTKTMGPVAMPRILSTVLTTLCILPFGPIFMEARAHGSWPLKQHSACQGIYEMMHESIDLLPAIRLL